MTSEYENRDYAVDVDFDPHSVDYGKKSKALFDEYREKCPVAWTSNHGGYWLLTRYDDVAKALSDHTHFSSEHDLPEDLTGFPQTGSGFRGVGIPEMPFRFVPTEADPPLSTAIRALEAPFFTPAALEAMIPDITSRVDAKIDAVIEAGTIDFAADLGLPVTYHTALALAGVDPTHWQDYSRAGEVVRYEPSEPEYPLAEMQACTANLFNMVAKRRKEPHHDVASALVAGDVLGRKLTDHQVTTILTALVLGGAHTVTATLLSALVWFEKRLPERERVLADDKLMTNAIEEFVRFVSPAQNGCRNVKQDMEIRGRKVRRGDRVIASVAAGNRDPNKFECPDEIRIDRKNAAQHLGYGGGTHRCLGAPLARLQIKIILTQVFKRLPDYTIVHDQVEQYERSGRLNSLSKLPATFQPGARGEKPLRS